MCNLARVPCKTVARLKNLTKCTLCEKTILWTRGRVSNMPYWNIPRTLLGLFQRTYDHCECLHLVHSCQVSTSCDQRAYIAWITGGGRDRQCNPTEMKHGILIVSLGIFTASQRIKLAEFWDAPWKQCWECRGPSAKGGGLKFCNLQNMGSNPGLVSRDTCVIEQDTWS